MLGGPGPERAAELVEAALRVADRLGKDVADVPMLAIAHEAGISRSTLVRRLGGSRRALDEAVRAAGVDPGGQRPVHDRAVAAGARLISEHGLAAATLEAVATAAQCSVHSLYAAFGCRDALLRAIFERYFPILDVEAVVAASPPDMGETVTRIYCLMAEALSREPRVAPAMFAEALARPTDPVLRALLQHFCPRMLTGLGRWLASEVAAGRLRDVPLPLLMQQMVTPVLVHFLLRPAATCAPGMELPGVEETCAVFAEAFLRAVAEPRPDRD
ncbi:DNA-binding transcriptional regulator, AcrR family [Sinosporangium album]|uniref:DNA-binding transcriptional regulator, AcrR family n=1 Tax=Sinosporangium album TaxID=504805 RepID=A0A1G8DC49_9ACTN|nr:DNA-binding transcriptional regulator, AcrR family [Sinosporangium album]